MEECVKLFAVFLKADTDCSFLLTSRRGDLFNKFGSYLSGFFFIVDMSMGRIEGRSGIECQDQIETRSNKCLKH